MNKSAIIFLLMVFAVSIHIFALLAWEKLNSKNIYYMCAAMAMYTISLVVYLMAKKSIEKAGSYILMSVFGVNLYVEFMGDPVNWKWRYYWLIPLICVNFFLFALIVEKIRK